MTADLPHILVVDDDRRLRELLQRFLSGNGFVVTSARDAAECRQLLRSLAFDLIVLDVMMPGEDGFSLTESLRRDSTLPILLLTARGDVEDRIAGLERGADDYLTKPFEPRELLLRIGTILRRVEREIPRVPERIRFGAYVYDPGRGELWHDEEPVRLTEIERSLLRVLVASAGQPVSREALISESRIAGGARTVDVQVTRLRRKIEPNPRAPRYLRTVRGEGYALYPD